MHDLLPTLSLIAGAIGSVALIAVVATWVLLLATLSQDAAGRAYLAGFVTREGERETEITQGQHLSIAGLVLAALAIGNLTGTVAQLLVASFAAYVFAWALTWAPALRVSQVGGDALMWTGAASLLLAVFLFAQPFGLLAQFEWRRTAPVAVRRAPNAALDQSWPGQHHEDDAG